MAGEVRSGDETTETGDAGEVGERIWELRWTVERVLALVCVFKAGERKTHDREEKRRIYFLLV